MRICQISHGRINPDGANGITRTIYNLNKSLNSAGIASEIYCFDDRQSKVEDFQRDEFTKVKLFPRSKFFRSSDFAKFIMSDKFVFDLVHFHMMWMIDKNIILKYLRKRNIPYIITVHGAYAPNLIDSIKKRISMLSFEKQYLKNASCLHALCFEEKAYLRNLGLKMPIYTIPNGISDQEILKINNSRRLENPFDDKSVNILWVGQIRPDKNVGGIIKSINFLKPHVKNKIRIHIVGGGNIKYLKFLKELVKEDKNEGLVFFHGPKYKEEKYQFILNSDIYIQPSFSEGISFSILDAMACGKPMILSRQTNMTYYYNKNFYEMTEPFPEDIASSITKLVLNETLCENLSRNSKIMIKNFFNWDALLDDYKTMYLNVIKNSRL